MGVITTVDVIQSIPDVWRCALAAFHRMLLAVLALTSRGRSLGWLASRYGAGNESGTFPNYGQMTIGVPKDHPTIGDAGLTLVEAQSHFRWSPAPHSYTSPQLLMIMLR